MKTEQIFKKKSDIIYNHTHISQYKNFQIQSVCTKKIIYQP